MKKESDFSAFENAPDKKPSYTPPYKFKPPTAPQDAYDIICPYFASPAKNIQFSNEPIKFAVPRLEKAYGKLSQQLRAPSPNNNPKSKVIDKPLFDKGD